MTTKYRVEYALKTHRRDEFIEWIKALLAVPFTLYSTPSGAVHGFEGGKSEEAHRRYAEIMKDIAEMVDDYLDHVKQDSPLRSKLKVLVPSVGPFFTPLPLEQAFRYQDQKRFISSRRFVSPSFNDIRLTLNTAQLMALTAHPGSLELATFDGDITLYDDGQNLEPTSPIVPRMLALLGSGVRVGIVTAAGYTTAAQYHSRLAGLLDAVATAPGLTPAQRTNLVVMGGEANFLFAADPLALPHRLTAVPRARWLTSEMRAWAADDIAALLDTAEAALRDCVRTLAMPATVVRKDRAVGIVGSDRNMPISRETLEETVLVVQKTLEVSPVGLAGRVPFCAFNGGRDVFVDIGDKSWGVRVCQRWFGGGKDLEGAEGEGRESIKAIAAAKTLHVGDQFLSAGANDFRARSAAATAWIASPAETVELLDEVAELMKKKKT